MTQETLDMVVHAYCEGCQEFIGDYEFLILSRSLTPQSAVHKSVKPFVNIGVRHKEIEELPLPWGCIYLDLKPKEQAKIIIELVKEVIEFGDEWLQDEQDYYADKAAEKWDNDRKTNLVND
jgi:hypothetical protein